MTKELPQLPHSAPPLHGVNQLPGNFRLLGILGRGSQRVPSGDLRGLGSVRVRPAGGLRQCPLAPTRWRPTPRIQRRCALLLAAPARRHGNALATGPVPPHPPSFRTPIAWVSHKLFPLLCPPRSLTRGISSAGGAPARGGQRGGRGGETVAKAEWRWNTGRIVQG